MAALATGGDPAVRPSACQALAAMDVPPDGGPPSSRRAGATAGLRYASTSGAANQAKVSPTLPSPIEREGGSPSPLPSPIQGEGVASKPYGADGRIAEKTGVVNTF